MKIRQWEITTETGNFRFVAESKVLAHDHACTLKVDPTFIAKHGRVLYSGNINERVRHIALRFVGWTENE